MMFLPALGYLFFMYLKLHPKFRYSLFTTTVLMAGTYYVKAKGLH